MAEARKEMNLKNIGSKTEPWLREVGVQGYDDLEQLGSVEVYKRLKARYPEKITLNALYAMEAALWDLHWLELPKEVKEDLERQVAGQLEDV